MPKQGYTYLGQTGKVRTYPYLFFVKSFEQDRYYIAAEEQVWNYAPSSINLMTNSPYTSSQAAYTTKGSGRVGPSYIKARYV